QSRELMTAFNQGFSVLDQDMHLSKTAVTNQLGERVDEGFLIIDGRVQISAEDADIPAGFLGKCHCMSLKITAVFQQNELIADGGHPAHVDPLVIDGDDTTW